MRRTPHDGSGTGHGDVAQVELLKMQKSEGDNVRGIFIIISVIFSNFVSGSFIK